MPGVNSECGKHCMDSYSENLSKKDSVVRYYWSTNLPIKLEK